MADALSELYMLALRPEALRGRRTPGRATSRVSWHSPHAERALPLPGRLMRGVIDNFPNTPARWAMRLIVFPFGSPTGRRGTCLASCRQARARGAGGARSPDAAYLCLQGPRRSDRAFGGHLDQGHRRRGGREEARARHPRGRGRRYHGIDWIGEAKSKGFVTATKRGHWPRSAISLRALSRSMISIPPRLPRATCRPSQSHARSRRKWRGPRIPSTLPPSRADHGDHTP